MTSGAPQMPSRSSVSWNASPACAPNPARPMASSAGAPTPMAPMLQAQAISAAVLSPAISRHSSSVTSSRRSKARSAPWPAISRCTAATGSGPPRRPAGRSASRMSWARHSRASPARMAAPTPNTVHAVGRCRRSVSPSMMSSCSSEKLCTNSTAAAAATPRSAGAPAARADSRARAGRRALPPLARPRWARRRRRRSPGDRRRRSRTSGLSRSSHPAMAGPTRSRAAATPAGMVVVMTTPLPRPPPALAGRRAPSAGARPGQVPS